jgi:hypothetical protein
MLKIHVNDEVTGFDTNYYKKGETIYVKNNHSVVGILGVITESLGWRISYLTEFSDEEFHIEFEWISAIDCVVLAKDLNHNSGLSINNFAKEVHENSIYKGWWEKEISFTEFISLCHCELSEALQDYRDNCRVNRVYEKDNKPTGIPVELADCILRILDFCAANKIDIEQVLTQKHEYNKTRSYRHGDKKI